MLIQMFFKIPKSRNNLTRTKSLNIVWARSPLPEARDKNNFLRRSETDHPDRNMIRAVKPKTKIEESGIFERLSDFCCRVLDFCCRVLDFCCISFRVFAPRCDYQRPWRGWLYDNVSRWRRTRLLCPWQPREHTHGRQCGV